MDKTPTSGPIEGNGEIANDFTSSESPETCKHQSLPSTSPAIEKTMCARKNYKRAANRIRKCSQVLAGRYYSLRSSHSNVMVHFVLCQLQKIHLLSLYTIQYNRLVKEQQGADRQK